MDTPVHLLLVDDHTENLVALESILDHPDYRITKAQFAQNALLSLLTTDFALVVLDVHMPEINGLELARMIKERPRTSEIPIIFLTAHDREEQQALTGYQAGAVDYVTKPVNPAILRSKVAIFVELYRKSQELRETVRSLKREIVERKSAEERLAVEHAVTRALAELVAVPDASKKILQIFCQSFAWDVGEIWLVDPASRVLGCIEIWHPSSAEFKEFAKSRRQMTFAPSVGLAGQIWTDRLAKWIPDFTKRSNLVEDEIPSVLGLHSAFGFPIQFHGEILGVLNFFSAEIRQPDANSVAMLTALGSQVGSLIARKNLADQLRQAQKMEAFGQLAGGVAHDFNNILAVIMGYTDLLMERGNLSVEVKDQLSQIYSAGERAANLTRQLLTFSRKRQMEITVLDLNEVVLSMTKMLRRIIGEDIDLRCNHSADLPAVEADESMVQQILMNLVVNARDAMPGGGQLIISTNLVITDAAYVQMNPDARVGRFVCLTIQDMGCGMPPEVKARIFEPFFTTKNVGRGTGLGLATVHGIVKQHQGWIEVESLVGAGTTFKIFLPASSRSATTDEQTTREIQILCGHETILLVEDDKAVRDVTKIVLERHGYRVLEAESGEETLFVWELHDREVDLLLTDINMPGGLTGVELANRLRARKPSLKVIYSSGYITDPEETRFRTREIAPLLQKPYNPQKLLRAVRVCLDAAVS